MFAELDDGAHRRVVSASAERIGGLCNREARLIPARRSGRLRPASPFMQSAGRWITRADRMHVRSPAPECRRAVDDFQHALMRWCRWTVSLIVPLNDWRQTIAVTPVLAPLFRLALEQRPGCPRRVATPILQEAARLYRRLAGGLGTYMVFFEWRCMASVHRATVLSGRRLPCPVAVTTPPAVAALATSRNLLIPRPVADSLGRQPGRGGKLERLGAPILKQVV